MPSRSEIRAKYKASEKGKENARRYAISEKGRISQRNARLKYEYGITLKDYERMLREQGYRCEVCGIENWTQVRGLVVDHDHETDEIRGLLCDACNTGLGKFLDSPEVLRAAADYLERTRG